MNTVGLILIGSVLLVNFETYDTKYDSRVSLFFGVFLHEILRNFVWKPLLRPPVRLELLSAIHLISASTTKGKQPQIKKK